MAHLIFARAHSSPSRSATRRRRQPRVAGGLLLLLSLIALSLPAVAQSRLKEFSGYRQFERMSQEIPKSVTLGALNVTWTNGGSGFTYRFDGHNYAYDIATMTAKEIPNTTNAVAPSRTNSIANGNTNSNSSPSPSSEAMRRRVSRERERPERGRQFTNAVAPDGSFRAFYRNQNLWLSRTNGQDEKAITTTGSESSRLKFGTANWVYGEELYQTTAIWWSSNSQKVAFYRFDESKLPDYFLGLDQTRIQSRLDREPYMKAGAPNPVVDLMIYDVATGRTTQVDARSGQPFSDAVVGHYLYGVSWTADHKELLFHRTNRRQNIMELCAADPATGHCRVIVREEWAPSWTENLPTFQFLKDGRRFIWSSERTGWKNYYLYDLDGRQLATLTSHKFEVASIEHVDEAAGLLYYMARSGDNPLKLQLHRVRLDGRDDRRLTNPYFHHTVSIAPDAKHFIDVSQTHDTPPTTRLLETDGKTLGEIVRSDTTRFDRLGLKPVELISFKAAHGSNTLYGMLHYPSNFKPTRRYPLLVSVYAGPATTGARETFTLPSSLTELGFLVASFDSSSADGRGKRALDAIYQKLGTVEIDDQAAAVRELRERRYVDGHRVGIHGTSYGGFASALSLLRYPDVFQAACANSAVTDFRNYDSIYTERYLGLPQENKQAYDNTRLSRFAPKLSGHLMIYYGTADNNVHPANALQLISALQAAGKSFDVQVGPDLGHTAVNRDRMMEFFIDSFNLR